MIEHPNSIANLTVRGRPAVAASAAGPLDWKTALRRAFWAIMLIGHGPALLRVTGEWLVEGDASAGLRALALAGFSVLFALKVLDVAWLRLPGDRRSVVTLSVAVLLLHAGVISRNLPAGAAETLVAVKEAATLGGLAVMAGLVLRRVRRVDSKALRDFAQRLRRLFLLLVEGQRAERLLPAPEPVACCRANRAPPFSSHRRA